MAERVTAAAEQLEGMFERCLAGHKPPDWAPYVALRTAPVGVDRLGREYVWEAGDGRLVVEEDPGGPVGSSRPCFYSSEAELAGLRAFLDPTEPGDAALLDWLRSHDWSCTPPPPPPSRVETEEGLRRAVVGAAAWGTERLMELIEDIRREVREANLSPVSFLSALCCGAYVPQVSRLYVLYDVRCARRLAPLRFDRSGLVRLY